MRILVFTGPLDFNVRWNLVALADRFLDATITVVQHCPKKTLRQLLLNQARNMKRHGWRWAPYQGKEIFDLLLNRIKPQRVESRDVPGSAFSISAIEQHPRIHTRRFSSVNSDDAQIFIESIMPDLGIALGGPILKEKVFAIPRLGTINLHKGKVPDYRGMPPAFWELNNGEVDVGCTIHKVESGLDSGDILIARSVKVDRFSTLHGVKAKLNRLGVEMVCDAVGQIISNTAVYLKQALGGKTNTRPLLAVEAKLKRKLAAKQPTAGGALRSGAKKLVFAAHASILMPVVNLYHGLTHQQRIIILLYHRVSDEFRDNVTIGIEQFDKHMAFLKTNFAIVSLKEIVEGRVSITGFKPTIAVSFDDGYLDNFENAAPILLKHGIPCTFFISTENISENRPFEHDLNTLGFGLDNMNWEQVKQMHKWGFHFGSHTKNHVNLAEVSDEIAADELLGSLQDIRMQLGEKTVFLAYPYGGKKHINQKRISLVKDLGYSACFSAYGGLNNAKHDVFDIKRVGINWAFDLVALHSRLRGWDRAR